MNKQCLSIFTFFCLLLAPWAFAVDEADIPPPPMPEYMKKHQERMDQKKSKKKRKPSSFKTLSEYDNQSADSVKEEFLQAGSEDLEVAELPPVRAVDESPMEELSEENIAEAAQEVYEDPVAKPPVEEISEVEVAEPEFEQATITTPQEEKAKEDFQRDVGNKEPAIAIAQDKKDEEVLGAVEENNSEEKETALTAVEEKLELAEKETEANLQEGRKPSGKKQFKSGMYKFSKKCTMHSEPRSFSDEVGSIRPGRKLWIDAHDDNWHKAYKKSGTVYISADCL